MGFDPSKFPLVCVTDTCSVWHMLSSERLFAAAAQAGRKFCITPAVLYECVQKPRNDDSEEQVTLRKRLTRAREAGHFPLQGCTIEDLLAVSAGSTVRLSLGELSCMAAAYQIRSISFMTDEKLARRHSESKLGLSVETTPRLYGYLHYHRHLSDDDHGRVQAEHARYERRPLTVFFETAYNEAQRCRLADNVKPASETPHDSATSTDG